MPPESLSDLQKSHGAVFAGGESVSRPLHFGDPAREYAAAATASALFDLSDRTNIELTGGDRARFLHNFCTSDIKSLASGQGCEAFVTNVKGRVLGHIFVFAAPASLWIESGPGTEESLLSHLDRYLITEDVALHARTAECGELFASGPRSAAALRAANIEAASLQPYAHMAVDTLDHPCFVRRVDWLGAPGYLLSAPRVHLAALWQRLFDGNLTPAGSQAFEALRIEAGLPVYGRDVTEDHMAQEVGRTKLAISFTKGCYLGQEPIARIDALGHVNRELRGLRLSEGPVPDPDSAVTAGDDDKEIGRITSSALSYADGRPVALAYLRTRCTQPGTKVHVQTSAGRVEASVFWPLA